MNFYKQAFPHKSPPADASYPCVVLVSDGWDDFSFHTLWNVMIYRSAGEMILEGQIKILQRDPDQPDQALKFTRISERFPALTEDYCSLGQNLEFYKGLLNAGAEIYEPYFTAMRDVTISPEIATLFSGMEGFKVSLLRFSEAEKAFTEGRSLFIPAKVVLVLRFQFTCRVPGADSPHKVEFDFRPHPTELNRTCVIIGKNGTGKTQFLAQFARAMSGWRSPSDTDQTFEPQRPSFSRVITVSYSVFDDFVRPPEDSRTFSYKYCGIREPDPFVANTPEGVIPPASVTVGARFFSPEKLRDKLKKAHAQLRALEREGLWKDIVRILLEGTIEPTEESFNDLSFYDRLSSGQRILVAVITEIIAHIVKQSIILFDEPELHLHPEILAAWARAFDRLLHVFDSYSIIATHSTLLLQETMAQQVKVFQRQGNTPIIAPLTVESFGENLTRITSQVFAVDGTQHNFRAHLDKLAVGRTFEQVEALFPMGLPLQAQAYLKSLETPKPL